MRRTIKAVFYVCECVAADQFKPLDRPRESDRTTFVEAWGFGILVELNHRPKKTNREKKTPGFPTNWHQKRGWYAVLVTASRVDNRQRKFGNDRRAINRRIQSG